MSFGFWGRSPFIKFMVLGTSVISLAGCEKLWPFSQPNHYVIQSQSDDAELNAYMNEVIKDRLKEKIEKSDDRQINYRRETYREQQIQTDLEKALKAKGYYDGRVQYVDERDKQFSGQYQVDAGEKYKIVSLRVVPNGFKENLDVDGIEAGQPLDAAKILLAQENLKTESRRGHCYFKLDVNNEVRLNHVNKTGAVTLRVDAGPEANFGPVTFTGNEKVKDAYLRKLIPWKEGDCYRINRVERLKTALLESGLFSGAVVVLPDAPMANGEVPIEVQLTERAARTVKAGASYYSDEGLGVSLGWQHRNIFGGAEKLAAELSLSQLKQSLDIDVTKPYFLRNDQELTLGVDLRRQDTDAYDELGIGFDAVLTRKINRFLSVSAGPSLNITKIKDKTDDNQDENLFGLISFPISAVYDNRRNKLDPKSGWNLAASAEPFFDAMGEADPFLKLQLSASTYLAFDDDANYILALRVMMGSIVGSDVSGLPPTERFYAGGGGTIRGYGYQEVGPKDDNGDPTGGRSFVATSAEMRVKFTDKIGGVAFVDAGNVTDETYPEFQNVAVGAGVGVRYYTGFGPLRFDIAVPLTEKESLERNYQFYLSIGQAF